MNEIFDLSSNLFSKVVPVQLLPEFNQNCLNPTSPTDHIASTSLNLILVRSILHDTECLCVLGSLGWTNSGVEALSLLCVHSLPFLEAFSSPSRA
ncbi:MAG: hypothetical protein OXF06_02905 [Bacteroidetes bacterium]|nr:hypothetical protein [Bacteroidota bacterium]